MTTPVRKMQLADLDGKAAITVEEVADLLGLGRTAAYDAIKRGDLPSFKIGRRVLVPVGKLKLLLGVE